jgi:hypothetical protein
LEVARVDAGRTAALVFGVVVPPILAYLATMSALSGMEGIGLGGGDGVIVR